MKDDLNWQPTLDIFSHIDRNKRPYKNVLLHHINILCLISHRLWFLKEKKFLFFQLPKLMSRTFHEFDDVVNKEQPNKTDLNMWLPDKITNLKCQRKLIHYRCLVNKRVLNALWTKTSFKSKQVIDTRVYSSESSMVSNE